MPAQRLGGRRASADVLADHPQGLLKAFVSGTLDEQIPHAKHRKARFDQRQQFLVENQKVRQRKPAKCVQCNDRPTGREPPAFELKDEKALALEFCPNGGLLVAFNLALER
jgi:hypothetical protein